MKGIFNFRLFAFLILLMGIYLFLCDFHIPVKNIGKKTESVAYVDSVKQLHLFDLYSYGHIYYHCKLDRERFIDSLTSNRYSGSVNKGDSLLVVISKMNPVLNTVKSVYGRSQDPMQVMSR